MLPLDIQKWVLWGRQYICQLMDQNFTYVINTKTKTTAKKIWQMEKDKQLSKCLILVVYKIYYKLQQTLCIDLKITYIFLYRMCCPVHLHSVTHCRIFSKIHRVSWLKLKIKLHVTSPVILSFNIFCQNLELDINITIMSKALHFHRLTSNLKKAQIFISKQDINVFKMMDYIIIRRSNN